MPRIWLVTGCTTGFGKYLIEEILEKGDIAVATARKPETLSFSGTSSKNFLAVKLDVTSNSDIDTAFQKTIDTFGRVDVVVNNAGYGLTGPFEELTEQQARTQFDVNFFGLMQVTRKAMEVMRTQQPSGGVIQQVTSIGGQQGFPLFSVYCASKWAVEGFTESISYEVKPEWNIKFLCCEPGGFRTDWWGRSMAMPPERNPAYDHLKSRDAIESGQHKPPGDPKKGAQAMYKLAIMKDPPLRAVIGSDAYGAIHQRIAAYKELYSREDLSKIARSTDADD